MKSNIIAMIGVLAALLTALLAMLLPKIRRAFLVAEDYVGLLYHEGKFVKILNIEESGAS